MSPSPRPNFIRTSRRLSPSRPRRGKCSTAFRPQRSAIISNGLRKPSRMRPDRSGLPRRSNGSARAKGGTGSTRTADRSASHPEARPEAGLLLALISEAAALIEQARPRVGDNGEAEPFLSRLVRGRIDEQAADPEAPQVGFDEEAVELTTD